MLTFSSGQAQNRFGAVLDAVQREPIAITRHGRTAAFLISPTLMEALQAAQANASVGQTARAAAAADQLNALTAAHGSFADEYSHL